MNNATLVDREVLKKDPRKLAFLYPRMPVIRYKKLTEQYYHELAIQAVEQAGKALNGYILPAACVHHRRKDPAKRISLFGRSYYAIPADDITPLELAKYKAIYGEGKT